MNIEPFRLERYFAKYEFEVPFLMSSSDCESVTVEDLLSEEERRELMELCLGYTPSDGTAGLRREISRLYTNCSENDVLVHAGAEEAIFTLFHAILRPGDHLIVLYPCYQSLFEIAASIGCDVTYWPLHFGKTWTADMDELEGLLRSNTRMIVVNSPHNPTGFHFSRPDWLRLATMSEANGLMIFSDEVYRFGAYREADELPPMADLTKNAVSLGVMSKSFGLAGLRIGWLTTRDVSVLEAVRTIKDYTTICCSAPSEFLATAALRKAEKILSRNRALVAANLELAEGFFRAHEQRFVWARPSAGPVAFPRDLWKGPASFADRLARDSGVMLLPGDVYGEEFKSHFRLGLGRKNFREALERYEAFLSHPRGL